jgi:UDP-2,3-diacylglucosamine pyrophosphatase LpxH
MALDKALAVQKLSELWECDDMPSLEIVENKYVLMSDIHFGNGGKADDFHGNENAFVAAMDHYSKEGYSLILLGDIEEFWQFSQNEIRERYNDTAYSSMRAFGDERIYRVYGNHDSDCQTIPDPAKNTPPKPACATEALKMKDSQGNNRFLLVHGHQGDRESDKHAWASRFWVRLFRIVEPLAIRLGLYGHGPATKTRIKKDYERILYSWAKESKVILICGHSHRAIFASKSYYDRLKEEVCKLEEEIATHPDDRALQERDRRRIQELRKEMAEEKKKKRVIDPTEPDREPLPCYFNTGCALFQDGITALEITHDEICLVKWHKDEERIPRFEVYQQAMLSTFIDQVIGSNSTS